MDYIRQFIEQYLKSEDGSFNLLGKFAMIALIFLAIFVITSIINHIVDRTFNDKRLRRLQVSDRRMNTLSEILKKVVKYILVFISDFL